MAITFHPRPGQILLCDFSTGFREPEMVKSARPVIVLSPHHRSRGNVVTVAALSTQKPEPVCPYHWLLPRAALPQLGRFQEKETWLKGDMIYSVGFQRLDLIRLGKRRDDGKREYFSQRLGRQSMAVVYACVLYGLGLNDLAASLQK